MKRREIYKKLDLQIQAEAYRPGALKTLLVTSKEFQALPFPSLASFLCALSAFHWHTHRSLNIQQSLLILMMSHGIQASGVQTFR